MPCCCCYWRKYPTLIFDVSAALLILLANKISVGTNSVRGSVFLGSSMLVLASEFKVREEFRYSVLGGKPY